MFELRNNKSEKRENKMRTKEKKHLIYNYKNTIKIGKKILKKKQN